MKSFKEYLLIGLIIASIPAMIYFTLVAFDNEAENYFEHKVEYRG